MVDVKKIFNYVCITNQNKFIFVYALPIPRLLACLCVIYFIELVSDIKIHNHDNEFI